MQPQAASPLARTCGPPKQGLMVLWVRPRAAEDGHVRLRSTRATQY